MEAKFWREIIVSSKIIKILGKFAILQLIMCSYLLKKHIFFLFSLVFCLELRFYIEFCFLI